MTTIVKLKNETTKKQVLTGGIEKNKKLTFFVIFLKKSLTGFLLNLVKLGGLGGLLSFASLLAF